MTTYERERGGTLSTMAAVKAHGHLVREVAQWLATKARGQVWRVPASRAERFLVGLPMQVRGVGLPISREYVVGVDELDVVPHEEGAAESRGGGAP